MAQNTAATPAPHAAHQASLLYYEGVNVVVKDITKKEWLMGYEEKLKKVGVEFTVKYATYNNEGLLTGVTVAVNVPGVYSGTVSSGNKRESLKSPLYFFKVRKPV